MKTRDLSCSYRLEFMITLARALAPASLYKIRYFVDESSFVTDCDDYNHIAVSMNVLHVL